MNNRQAGRRRGRGGQRPQGGGNPNRPESGNRIDNRARGNAAQLLEKYKNLARDAQMQGDRVNTEYYLQFADHYFRVLSETRSRFEENNRRPDREDDEDDFDMEGEPGTPDQFQGERREPRQERAERQDRSERQERPERPERQERPERAERQDRGERPDRGNRRDQGNGRRERANGFVPETDGEIEPPVEIAADAPSPEDAPRRRGRPRRQPIAEQDGGEVQPSIDADRLPPSLGLVSEAEEGDAPKPRRRRKARSDEDETASSAA